MERAEQNGWVVRGVVLAAIVLAVELLLSIARPIYLVSALATIAILVVFVRAARPRHPAGRAIREEQRSGHYAFSDSPDRPSVARRRAPSGQRQASRPLGWLLVFVVVGVVVAGVVVVATVGTVVVGGGKGTSPPFSGLLTAPLDRAQEVAALPVTNVILTLSLDTRTARWQERSLALAVAARKRHRQNARLTRALAAIGWIVQRPRIGPDGRRYLRFQRRASAEVSAHLPSATDWTPSSTIALGVPDVFPLGAGSRVLVMTPTGLVGTTEPAAVSTAPVPGSSLQITEIAFDANTPAVSVTLDGWVERHPGLRSLANLFFPVLLPSGVGVTLVAWLRKLRTNRQGAKGNSSSHSVQHGDGRSGPG